MRAALTSIGNAVVTPPCNRGGVAEFEGAVLNPAMAQDS
jgi:hypothetical protein